MILLEFIVRAVLLLVIAGFVLSTIALLLTKDDRRE